MKRIIAIVALSALTACARQTCPPAITPKTECDVFTDPGIAVRGLNLEDQQKISVWQETGIRVCGWKRPTKMSEAPISPLLTTEKSDSNSDEKAQATPAPAEIPNKGGGKISIWQRMKVLDQHSAALIRKLIPLR